ncbi:MAG: nucleotidyltransferase family protein [Gemmatimonadetes bacterium]|nr:nucleotidyltransferase family protein [Gemmatimonadota bacterium]
MSANKQHPFAAIVLAAGAGTRFGAPKVGARLPDGRRFLDAVIEHCLTAGADPVVAVVPPETPVPEEARVVVNPRASDEQVTSLRLGLAQLANVTAEGVLVWPVDHPFALATSGLAVVDAARRTGAPVVVPVHDGRRGHPVWFARETWRELMTVPEGGARAVVHAYGTRVHEVGVSDAGVLRDIDTKDDLDA